MNKVEKKISLEFGFRLFSTTGKRIGTICFLTAFTLIFLFSGVAQAQTDDFREIAPPPLKILSKDEKRQLETVTDVKKKTVLALELMDLRLKKVEELDDQDEFEKMYEELGGFHALMDYTLNFLYRTNAGTGKRLANFKRYEIGLRNFPPRLEVIRRELPIKYEAYLRELLKIIRETRAKAVEPFFSDSVIPNY